MLFRSHVVFGPIETYSLEEWNRIFAVHAGGTFLVCKHVLPIMRAQGSGSIVNSGTFSKIAGGGSSNIYVNVTNTGLLKVDSGTLWLPHFPVNSGTVEIAAGTALSTNGNALFNDTTGVIAGSGTLALGGNVLTNAGTLRPGGVGATGTLTIAGNLVQDVGGVIEVEVGGPLSSNQYDSLYVTGDAHLSATGSTLNVLALSPGPTPATAYPVIATGGTLFGTFDAINFASVAIPNYTSKGLSLMLGSPFNTWIRNGSGDWDDQNNWSYGHVPTASEDVVIDFVSGTYTINVSTAGDRKSTRLNSSHT